MTSLHRNSARKPASARPCYRHHLHPTNTSQHFDVDSTAAKESFANVGFGCLGHGSLPATTKYVERFLLVSYECFWAFRAPASRSVSICAFIATCALCKGNSGEIVFPSKVEEQAHLGRTSDETKLITLLGRAYTNCEASIRNTCIRDT